MKRKTQPDWPAIAQALVQRISHGALHPGAMLKALAEHERETRRGGRPSKWALAFSGGADSLALLLIFWAEGPGRWGRDFVVLHFNHRLRGRAADADEKFCADVCRALGVKFVAERWNRARAAGAGRTGGARPMPARIRPTVSEAQARAARFEFFSRQMTRRKMRLLWLGHQQDDIAETMLMRLARGSGSAGLAAPRPAQPMPEDRWHLRPLLTLKKSEIVAALRASGAIWREDTTNRQDDFFRNRIRKSVLPAWQRAAQRDALAGAALARELLEEDDVALEARVDELRPLARNRSLVLARIAGQPRAVVRRALRRWLLAQPAVFALSRQAFEALLAAVERGKPTRQSLSQAGLAVIRDGILCYLPSETG